MLKKKGKKRDEDKSKEPFPFSFMCVKKTIHHEKNTAYEKQKGGGDPFPSQEEIMYKLTSLRMGAGR